MDSWQMTLKVSRLTLKILECEVLALFSIENKVAHQTLRGSLPGDMRKSIVI